MQLCRSLLLLYSLHKTRVTLSVEQPAQLASKREITAFASWKQIIPDSTSATSIATIDGAHPNHLQFRGRIPSPETATRDAAPDHVPSFDRYTRLAPPLTTRPGVAPVCCPSLTTRVPLTHTSRMPVESWCASSKVARSAMVSASKITTSA